MSVKGLISDRNAQKVGDISVSLPEVKFPTDITGVTMHFRQTNVTAKFEITMLNGTKEIGDCPGSIHFDVLYSTIPAGNRDFRGLFGGINCANTSSIGRMDLYLPFKARRI